MEKFYEQAASASYSSPKVNVVEMDVCEVIAASGEKGGTLEDYQDGTWTW